MFAFTVLEHYALAEFCLLAALYKRLDLKRVHLTPKQSAIRVHLLLKPCRAPSFLTLYGWAALFVLVFGLWLALSFFSEFFSFNLNVALDDLCHGGWFLVGRLETSVFVHGTVVEILALHRVSLRVTLPDVLLSDLYRLVVKHHLLVL